MRSPAAFLAFNFPGVSVSVRDGHHFAPDLKQELTILRELGHFGNGENVA